jgi:hypothetical protein
LFVPAKKRPGKRKIKPRKDESKVWRQLRLLAVVALAGAGAWLLWPFWQLSQQFGVFSVEAPTRVYARPRILATGQLMGLGDLESELEELGYRSAGGGVPAPGQYSVSGQRLSVYLRSFPTPAGPGGGGILEAEFSREWLRSLHWRGRSVRRASLEPPLIATLYGPDRQERRPISLDALPEELIQAVLAAEDGAFFKHPGLSVAGIGRAAWKNVQGGGGLQGEGDRAGRIRQYGPRGGGAPHRREAVPRPAPSDLRYPRHPGQRYDPQPDRALLETGYPQHRLTQARRQSQWLTGSSNPNPTPGPGTTT